MGNVKKQKEDLSVHRTWLRRALTVGSVGVTLAVMPAAAIAAEVIIHPEGTLKLADRKLVAGNTVEIGGEKFAEHRANGKPSVDQ